MDVSALKVVEIEVDGEKLVHHFAELRDKEWIELQRTLGKLNGDDDTLARVLVSYDARCRRVDGYTIDGESHGSGPLDLMEARPDDWHEYIPADHKVEAWMKLVNGQYGKINSLMNSTG